MFDPEKSVVKESRQISTLAKVIGAKEALKKLEEGAKLTEAVLYTTDPSEVFIKLLYDAKEKLQPLIDAQDAKERYEAYVTEKSDEYNGYQLLFPNGDTEFVRYERINGNYNEGDIIAKNDIKPKYLVKKNRNKDKTSN